MNEVLKVTLKKYVTIFLNEYRNYLSKEQINNLENINYDTIIKFNDTCNPLGCVSYNQMYLSTNFINLEKEIKAIDGYGSVNRLINNKSLKGYLEQTWQVGYNSTSYYKDILIYLLFKLVCKYDSGLMNGIINYEVSVISRKYNIQLPNFYRKEELIALKLCGIIGKENIRKVLFLDKASGYKYLCNTVGYRFANLFYEVDDLINIKTESLFETEYNNNEGLVNYASDYDSITYGDVYNSILDFEAQNIL